MSVEIIKDIIYIDDNFEIVCEGNKFVWIHHDVFSDSYAAYLNKSELAQLITALQAMHDKMIDNNEGE